LTGGFAFGQLRLSVERCVVWPIVTPPLLLCVGGGGGGWARRSRAGCDNLSHWHNM